MIMTSNYAIEGDEVTLSEEYFSYMGKDAVFTRGKIYNVLKTTIVNGLGNNSVRMEDDKGIVRHISRLYLSVV